MTEEKEEKPKNNRPWKNESFHSTFEEADSVRKKLLDIWSSKKEHEGMQVKIKRLSQRFVVKTRLHPDFVVKEKKKSGKKNRKSRKRNTDKRESQVNETSL